MKLARTLALLVVGVAAAAAIVAALLPDPVVVDVARVHRGPLALEVRGVGRTRVRDRYIVTAPLAGNLARIELRPGDDVEAGDVLARIEPPARPLLDGEARAQLVARRDAAAAAERQARATLARADAAHAFAARELARVEELAASGAVPASQLDLARLELTTTARERESAGFGVRIAAHERSIAEAALGRSEAVAAPPEVFEVRAPVAGRVLAVARRSEGSVVPGEPLLELGDPRALEVVVDVLTSDAVAVVPGAAVRVESWGGPAPLEGHVERVEPAAFTKVSVLGVEEQRVNVVVELAPAAPSSATGAAAMEGSQAALQRLGDGFRVEAAIEVWRVDDAVQVPLGALFRAARLDVDDAPFGWAVYVADDDGRAHLRPVELGPFGASSAEVRGGLEPGELVIVHPPERVAEGVPVDPRVAVGPP